MSEQVNEGVSVEVTQAGGGGVPSCPPGSRELVASAQPCPRPSPRGTRSHARASSGLPAPPSLLPSVSPVAKLVQGPGWRLTGPGLLT